MQAFLLLVVGALAVIAIVAVLGFVAPFTAGLGVLLAVLVVLDPGGLGRRLRKSPGWWGIPGMRRASARAAPFALLVLVYAIPVPLGAYVLTHSVHLNSGASSPPQSGVNVGGPSTSVPTATDTPASTDTPPATPLFTVPAELTTPFPTDTPSPSPSDTPPASPTGAPVPTPPPPTQPPPNLCGAPPNPWNYNFCGGALISAPPGSFCSYFNCIASFWTSTLGYVDQCVDGTYSHSGGRKGACSSHGGERQPLYQ
jgi:hypothetical protein